MRNSIRIGIHGSRASGKSSYLASLYKKRADTDVSLKLPDNETTNMLEAAWNELRLGKRLEGNAVSKLKHVWLSLTHARCVYNVVTADYAGELVQRNSKTKKSSDQKSEDNGAADANIPQVATTGVYPIIRASFAKDAAKWMHASDALFIIVDSEHLITDTDEDLTERRNEIDLLITKLQRGKRLSKPLALVLTKWDLISNPLASVADEHRIAHDFIKKHHLLSELASGIEASSENFSIFPVSAFGGNIDRTYPPKEVCPFNTLAPLAWCCERVRQLRKKKFQLQTHLLSACVAIAFLIAGAGMKLHIDGIANKIVTGIETIPTPELQTLTASHETWRHRQGQYWLYMTPFLAIMTGANVMYFKRRRQQCVTHLEGAAHE